MAGISIIFSKQECIPVGCVPSVAVVIGGGGGSARGVCRVCVCVSRGVSAQEGVCVQGRCVCPRGGVCPGQVCLPGGCTPPPLWTEFLTHACENITFPQLLLRTVKIGFKPTRHLWDNNLCNAKPEKATQTKTTLHVSFQPFLWNP